MIIASVRPHAGARKRKNPKPWRRPNSGVIEINYRIAATEAAMLRKCIMEHMVAMGWE